jgi:ABC-2 type transport system ATP-binding protein
MGAVQLIHVTKKLGNSVILNDVTADLEKGRIYGFFGRNGSGKSMLFRAICGLIKPTSGEIRIHEKRLHHELSFPESVGVIIESPGFWDQYSGFDNCKMLASIKGVISDETIRSSIKRVGLDPDDRRAFRKYSLGMKQRLGIAQAIMESPDLLVLDEPTNALDEQGVEMVREILMEEKQRGATILIASHNKEDIEYLSDVKYRMSDGHLEQVYS